MQAFGGAPDGQAALVALFSVASAAGRLAAGHLPERALAARRTPRCAPAHCKTFFPLAVWRPQSVFGMACSLHCGLAPDHIRVWCL